MGPPACYGCGLADAGATCTLVSPFTTFTFDYSPKSLDTAHRIVEKGLAQLATLNKALEQLQKLQDQLHRTVVQHQNYLPAISRLPDEIVCWT